MVQYNPKDWITFIFRFHKSDTFRQLMPMMFVIGLYTYGVCYLEIEHWKLSEKSHVKNISIMHGMLGFVISLPLAYRTNTAYDRWWEGRKFWGSLVNSSRNLALKLSVILSDEKDKKFLRQVIPAYASILSKHLSNKEASKMLYENIDLEIDHEKHKPNQVAKSIFEKINELYKSGKITGDQLITINNELQTFTDVCGACERIKNTPRALGSNNIDHRLRQSHFRLDSYQQGFPWLGRPIAEVPNLKSILIIGSTLRKDHPLLALRVRQAVKNGAQLNIVNLADDDILTKVAQRAIVAPSELVRTLARILKAVIEYRYVESTDNIKEALLQK